MCPNSAVRTRNSVMYLRMLPGFLKLFVTAGFAARRKGQSFVIAGISANLEAVPIIGGLFFSLTTPPHSNAHNKGEIK